MTSLLFLAQQTPPPQSSWAPVVLLLLIAIGFVVGTIALSLWVGPRRDGPAKSQTYESGMTPIGTAHRRFNVRFYMVAMIFLVFDVEIVFFYPWATIFAQAAAQNAPGSGVLLVEMLVFAGILLVAYVYAWGKGVFRWE